MIKNITFSAEERVIQKARQKALDQNKSLNLVIRDFLDEFIGEQKKPMNMDELLSLIHFRFDRKYTREEMNER